MVSYHYLMKKELGYILHDIIWRMLPSKCFNPVEGMQTICGKVLKKQPSLAEFPDSYFAAFTDPRMHMKQHYHKLEPFLPNELQIIQEPNRQNCFEYALSAKPGKVKNSFIFWDILNTEGRKLKPFDSKKIREGDLVAYALPNIIGDVYIRHAGIYQGDNIVHSRWGISAPVIPHPLEIVAPNYWSGDFKHLRIVGR